MRAVAMPDDVSPRSPIVGGRRHAGEHSRVGVCSFGRGGKRESLASDGEDETTTNLRSTERRGVVNISADLIALSRGHGWRRRMGEETQKRVSASAVSDVWQAKRQ